MQLQRREAKRGRHRRQPWDDSRARRDGTGHDGNYERWHLFTVAGLHGRYSVDDRRWNNGHLA
jgi:hypothetical protein